MLNINGMHNFYFLSGLYDMRCKAQRIAVIIRGRYHCDLLSKLIPTLKKVVLSDGYNVYTYS